LNLWVQGQLGSGIPGVSFFMQTNPRQQLRSLLRARRNSLTPSEQAQAAQSLLRRLMSLPLFLRSQHVALYWATDGEIDLAPTAKQLWKMGKSCYLPVIHPTQTRKLWFVKYLPDSNLRPNRFDIPEPDHRNSLRIPAKLLDLVLMPLVGFDSKGARLGMGGGYYDSTFSFKHQQGQNKPWLIGVAHACQQANQLDTEAWDIPLDAVVTDEAAILIPPFF
jgi:5-formyltetrahydrofolate cyclo-ligase